MKRTVLILTLLCGVVIFASSMIIYEPVPAATEYKAEKRDAFEKVAILRDVRDGTENPALRETIDGWLTVLEKDPYSAESKRLLFSIDSMVAITNLVM